MYRKLSEKLLKWKERSDHKPLLITGVRQCGKTTLIQEFCSQQFERVAYIDFEKESGAAELFEYDLNPKRIIQELGSVFFGFEITPGTAVLILDEIQACPRALTSLKYFCEEMPGLHVVCASSLLEVEQKRKPASFPVGKIDRMQLYPMSFEEYLMATENQKYIELVLRREKSEPVPELCREPLEKAYKNYLITGGMPAAVAVWNETHDYSRVDEVLDGILAKYSEDFLRHAPTSQVPKIHWVWDSVPRQLTKENNKFVFSHVREGKRSSELEDALIWLKDAGLVYLTERVEKPDFPLSFSAEAAYFKVYMADVGLLRRMAGVDFRVIFEEMEHYDRFRGALAENYVQNQLMQMGYTPYFWRSGNQAGVDFVFEDRGKVIPVEVKSAENTRAKSYRLFCSRFGVKKGFKLSLKNLAINVEQETETISLPLYLIQTIERYLD